MITSNPKALACIGHILAREPAPKQPFSVRRAEGRQVLFKQGLALSQLKHHYVGIKAPFLGLSPSILVLCRRLQRPLSMLGDRGLAAGLGVERSNSLLDKMKA